MRGKWKSSQVRPPRLALRSQKLGKRDAALLLQLLREGRFPRIWRPSLDPPLTELIPHPSQNERRNGAPWKAEELRNDLPQWYIRSCGAVNCVKNGYKHRLGHAPAHDEKYTRRGYQGIANLKLEISDGLTSAAGPARCRRYVVYAWADDAGGSATADAKYASETRPYVAERDL